MKPPKFQIFWQQFRETTENSNNNQWYQGINMKKYERFTMIYDIGDILVILLMNTITL